MYVGRDMSELATLTTDEWTDKELAFFHHSLQQMTQFLNSEGVSIHQDVIKEIESRGGLHRDEADYQHGTRPNYE